MLRRLFHGQEYSFRAFGVPFALDHHRLSLREGAGLVEHERLYPVRQLQRVGTVAHGNHMFGTGIGL